LVAYFPPLCSPVFACEILDNFFWKQGSIVVRETVFDYSMGHLAVNQELEAIVAPQT
jgi:hypothetical protein